jgi:transcription elongation factor Elf1
MNDVRHHPRMLVTCPHCGRESVASETLHDWNTRTYAWRCCGKRAHLGSSRGGGKSRMEPSA